MAEKTTQSPGDEARRTALVVAVSTYSDPTLRQLRAPAEDAAERCHARSRSVTTDVAGSGETREDPDMADEQVARIVVSSLGGDVVDADDLAGLLRHELLDTGFDVDRPSVGAAPPGTKGDALGWAQLAVSFSGGLPALVAAIRTFTSRDETRKVTLTLSNDTLELTGPTSTQQQQLVDAWLSRHPPTKPPG